MQLTSPRPTKPSGKGPLSSRGGTLAVAGIAALIAAGALLLYLQQYRADLTAKTPVEVLVARSLLPKGMPGQVIADKHAYRLVKVRKSELKDRAITDPASLEDKALANDVYPGHQITAADLKAADDRVLNRLIGYQRAMSVPVDPVRGLIGKVEPGDRVDVVATLDSGPSGLSTGAQMVARNVLVLAVPSKQKGAAGSATQEATIRVDDDTAAQIAGAADNGKIWLVLRPPVGARSHDSTAAVNKAVKAKVQINATVRTGK